MFRYLEENLPPQKKVSHSERKLSCIELELSDDTVLSNRNAVCLKYIPQNRGLVYDKR